MGKIRTYIYEDEVTYRKIETAAVEAGLTMSAYIRKIFKFIFGVNVSNFAAINEISNLEFLKKLLKIFEEAQ